MAPEPARSFSLNETKPAVVAGPPTWGCFDAFFTETVRIKGSKTVISGFRHRLIDGLRRPSMQTTPVRLSQILGLDPRFQSDTSTVLPSSQKHPVIALVSVVYHRFCTSGVGGDGDLWISVPCTSRPGCGMKASLNVAVYESRDGRAETFSCLRTSLFLPFVFGWNTGSLARPHLSEQQLRSGLLFSSASWSLLCFVEA